MPVKQTLIIPVLLVLGSLAVCAQAQDAREIIRTSEQRMQGKTCRGSFAMKVTTPEYTRTMDMDSWWIGSEKALIVITAPPREAGNKTLKVGSELWMYLRNTETTIKVPPSMMLQSWNGSDFTNDDLVRESSMAEDYTHAILAEETVQGAVCWKLQLTPKPSAPVVWGRIWSWVRKGDYLPARMEYYDERGKLARVMVYSDYRSFGGRLFPALWTMSNTVKKGHATTFTVKSVEFDAKISDRIFSFRELERKR